MVIKVPSGGLLPPNAPEPHVEIPPLLDNAAKACPVAKTAVKPVPAGAPLPPIASFPHEEIEPSSFNAAKALCVA